MDLVAIDGSPLGEQDERYMREHHGLRAVLRMPVSGDLKPYRWFRPVHPRLANALASYLVGQARLYRPRPPVSDAIARLRATGDYDIVVGRYLRYAMTAGLHLHPRCILDADDVETEVHRSRLAEPGVPAWRRMVLRRHLRQLVPIVTQGLSRFSALWVSNPDDRALPGLERAQVLANLPFYSTSGAQQSLDPAPRGCRTAVIVSSWHYEPNARGLKIFLDGAWPEIRRSCPDAVLRVIGSKMSPALRDRLALVPGVEPVGFVEDLSRAYEDCAFAIAPVFSGGGTNIKVLEALWHGRTCLVTRAAYRGYQRTLPAGECLEVAEDMDALASSALRLYTDPDYRNRLATAGAAAVRRHYSFEGFRRTVSETVEHVLIASDNARQT